MSNPPLEGVLVVSLEQAVAAPAASLRLAEAGARVIKVERPEGDFTRGYDRAANGVSSYFAWANRGKESIALDLRDADDRRIMDGLLAEARTARALVMPSRYPEPFGLVAAEASLSGLPVITSSTALLGDEIAAGGIGWTCDTRDHEGFTNLLRDVADLPPDTIAAMSVKAASGVVELGNSPDAWIDAQLQLYENACADA